MVGIATQHPSQVLDLFLALNSSSKLSLVSNNGSRLFLSYELLRLLVCICFVPSDPLGRLSCDFKRLIEEQFYGSRLKTRSRNNILQFEDYIPAFVRSSALEHAITIF